MNNMITILGTDINLYGVVIFTFLGVLIWGMVHAQRNQSLNWTDLLTRDGTKVSATKLLQLIGGIVGTWIVIKLTLQNLLTWDLFAIYLSYVASIDGFSKFIMAKYGVSQSDDSAVPYKKTEN